MKKYIKTSAINKDKLQWTETKQVHFCELRDFYLFFFRDQVEFKLKWPITPKSLFLLNIQDFVNRKRLNFCFAVCQLKYACENVKLRRF